MDDFPLTAADIIVAGIVGVSAAYAMWRGLVQETLAIFGWVAAALATLYTFPVFKPVMRQVVEAEWLADTLTVAGVFLAVLIPLSFIAHRFTESVKNSPVGAVDRTLGLVFGFARGLVLVGIVYIVFTALVPTKDHPQWIRQARLLPLIQGTSDVLLGLVPGDNVAQAPSRSRSAARPARRAEAEKPRETGKSYGADERRALDRLIEATGDDETSGQ